MTLYWIRNIKANQPNVLRYSNHHTNVNKAARDIFNGNHSLHFPKTEKKHDPSNDVLLYAEEQILLYGFHQDELQEESDE